MRTDEGRGADPRVCTDEGRGADPKVFTDEGRGADLLVCAALLDNVSDCNCIKNIS